MGSDFIMFWNVRALLMDGLWRVFLLLILCHYNAVNCTSFAITMIADEDSETSSNDFFDSIFYESDDKCAFWCNDDKHWALILNFYMFQCLCWFFVIIMPSIVHVLPLRESLMRILKLLLMIFLIVFFMKVMTNVLFDAMMISTGLWFSIMLFHCLLKWSFF